MSSIIKSVPTVTLGCEFKPPVDAKIAIITTYVRGKPVSQIRKPFSLFDAKIDITQRLQKLQECY